MIPFPNKKYNIIYADPAWKHKAWNKKGQKTAANHYSVMNTDDIKKLPIENIAHENCWLFCWTTYPHLEEALEVIKEWGFTYKTVAFTWVKRNKKSDSWFWGLGSYTRANAEICLLATKGVLKRKSASVHSILDDRIMEHSKKPIRTRDRIVELLGDLPRIELFARETADGWDSWGNEIG
jgi:N6-adenosine-specific RNA methylase IME4